jgi:hypothetical protein
LRRQIGVRLEIRVTAPDQPTTSVDLDSLILGCATQEWQKVTMLIAATVDATKAQAVEVTAQTIAGHIYALAESGKLEGKGNIRRWRTSEIRRRASA